MFLIIVDYKKPLEEVERYLAEHWAFLDRYFAQGKLLCTGPQNPRTGGVIVSKAANRAEAEAFTREDPFFRHEIADYTIVEFEPTKYLPGFEKFRSHPKNRARPRLLAGAPVFGKRLWKVL